MSKQDVLLARVEALEQRNQRVELEKAWETSWVRRTTVMALTYVVIACCLGLVVHVVPWISALVPVLGFFLSTLTISVLKKVWMHRR